MNYTILYQPMKIFYINILMNINNYNRLKRKITDDNDSNNDNDNDSDNDDDILEEDYNPFKKKRPIIPFPKMSQENKIMPEKRAKIPDTFNDYVKSYFFTKTIINEYTSEIPSELNDKLIINLDDIFEYFKDMGSSSYHIARNLIDGILAEDICSGIHPSYIQSVLTRVIEQPHNNRKYDIAFIIDPTMPKNVSSIVSLIIVQRSECFMFEDAYALNLICSRKCFKCGYILIGLYLYSILCHPKIVDLTRQQISPILLSDLPPRYYGPPILHIGLLEISGGYNNISGLCLYTKFGFIMNPKLSGPTSNCFYHDNNIAMVKRFISNDIKANDDTKENILQDQYDIAIEKQKIISIVNKSNPGYKKHIICDFTNKEIQTQLGLLYNQLKQLEKEDKTLTTQSKWLVNKLTNGELKPEFVEKQTKIREKIAETQRIINLIETSDKNITLAELGLSGGRKTKKQKYKKYKKNKTNKKRRNKSIKRH